MLLWRGGLLLLAGAAAVEIMRSLLRFIDIPGQVEIGAAFVLIWPWLRALPWPIQFGFTVSALGLLVLMGSLIWERMEERAADRELHEEL
jgi:hypothetical protein